MVTSVLQLTNCHKVAAPMAAYLVKNKSRFHYSHDFKYVNLSDFENEKISDFDIRSDSNNIPFLKSEVANYLYRPTKLKNMCLYDFLCDFITTYKDIDVGIDECNDWTAPHPTKKSLCQGKKNKK